MDLAIVGGGPAGLRAAEVASTRGHAVTVYDAMPSVGRKFLVAGRGGLNLTHGEPVDAFAARYSSPETPSVAWAELLAGFSPSDLRSWAAGLGVETFQAGSGRVYPVEMKAAPLLRRWILRLRAAGVRFAMRHRCATIRIDADQVHLGFEGPDGRVNVVCKAAILALGGASWPQTGSTGSWLSVLGSLGIPTTPFAPANCGWEVPWPPALLAEAEGCPLKNVEVRAGEQIARGELLVTRYGLEGGPIYQLGRTLRLMADPEILIDFKPGVSHAELLRKLGTTKPRTVQQAAGHWKLPPAVVAVLSTQLPNAIEPAELAAQVKAFRIRLSRPRPIKEAISSAGGIRWSALTRELMLRDLPGVFVAGEMIDWEAPTGGYLMQGCFATGTRAAVSASAWIEALR